MVDGNDVKVRYVVAGEIETLDTPYGQLTHRSLCSLMIIQTPGANLNFGLHPRLIINSFSSKKEITYGFLH